VRTPWKGQRLSEFAIVKFCAACLRSGLANCGLRNTGYGPREYGKRTQIFRAELHEICIHFLGQELIQTISFSNFGLLKISNKSKIWPVSPLLIFRVFLFFFGKSQPTAAAGEHRDRLPPSSVCQSKFNGQPSGIYREIRWQKRALEQWIEWFWKGLKSKWVLL